MPENTFDDFLTQLGHINGQADFSLSAHLLPTCRGICGEVSQEGSQEYHFLPTFHSIGVKVYQEGSLRYHFLPTWHGIAGKLCQVIH